MFPFGSAAAASFEDGGRRGIQRKREKVLRFDEVGYEGAGEAKVEEAADVGYEDEGEDDVEDSLPGLCAARGIVLGFEGRVEGLVLWLLECVHCRGVVPIVDER